MQVVEEVAEMVERVDLQEVVETVVLLVDKVEIVQVVVQEVHLRTVEVELAEEELTLTEGLLEQEDLEQL